MGSSFSTFFVNKFIITDYLGSDTIGYMNAISTSTAVLVQPVWGVMGAWRYGKLFGMIVGAGAFTAFSATVLAYEPSQLGTWSSLVPLFMCYGGAVGTWEGVNKSVYADVFAGYPDRILASFSQIHMSNGIASTIGYFSFPHMEKLQMTALCIAVVSTGLLCHIVAVRVLPAPAPTADAELDSSSERTPLLGTP